MVAVTRCSILWLVFGLLILSRAAKAEDSVAIVPFEGPKAVSMEKEVRIILKQKGYRVVAAKDGEGAVAAITGTVRKKKKRWSLVVSVLDSVGGTVRGKTTFKTRKPKKLARMVKAKFWTRVGAFVDAGSGSESEPVTIVDIPEPPPTTKTASVADGQASTKVSAKAVSPKTASAKNSNALEASLSIGTKIINRRFNYKDDLRKSLATYDIDAMTALAVEGELYPIETLGIAASYAYVPSFNSGLNGVSDEPFPTTYRAFLVGVRGRYKLGRASGQVEADYGGQNFTIKGALASATPIPNIRYRFVRAGASIKLRFSSLYTAVSGGYRHILSSGEISEEAYFPRLNAAGVDARFVVGYELFSGLSVELAATMERYFFAMNPEVGDSLIAGGAVDFYRGGQISLRYRH